MHGLRKASPGDTLDVQGFVGDETVGIDERLGLLVVEVPALVRRLLVQPGDVFTGLAASCGALLAPSKPPLSPAELLLRLPVVAGRLNRLAIGGDEERLESEVYADCGTVSRSFGRLADIRDEDDVPLSTAVFDGDGLDLSLDRSMQLDLDMSDVLKVEPSVVLEAASVAVGWELDEAEAVAALEAGVARLFTGLQPSEECVERTIQSAKRRLRAGKVRRGKARVGPARLLELARLLAVGDASPLRFVRVPAFSERRVVQASVGLEYRGEGLGLGAVGVEPVSVSPFHPSILQEGVGVQNYENHGEEVAATPPLAKTSGPLAA